MYINQHFLGFLRKELGSGVTISGGIAGFISFIAHILKIHPVHDNLFLSFIILLILGFLVGAISFCFLSLLFLRVFPTKPSAILRRISSLFIPLWLLILFPLDLSFSDLRWKLPPLNHRIFYIIAFLYFPFIGRVLLTDSKFKYIQIFIKYFFFFLLSLLLFQSFGIKALRGIIIDLLDFFDLYFISSVGLVTLFLHRKEIVATEAIESSEIKRLHSSIQNFHLEHPKLSSVPFLRRLFRRLYIEGWAVSALLMAAVLCGSFCIFYRLGYQDFRNDEYHQLSAAKGFLETRTFKQWIWYKDKEWNFNPKRKGHTYTRAWPHTVLIAASFKLFGVSEWSARLPSALLGVVFYFMLYFISRYLWDDRWRALLITLVFSFNLHTLELFRQTRMYAPLLVLGLLCFYLIFSSLIESNRLDLKLPWLKRFIAKYFNFNLISLFLFV
ncbi:MAG: glycosyltransferase family 39 protein, partial [Proteobacteria bacterium]|nr:glycosyltransferase family 39 protein [Pseudomonadota bacterium]